MDIFDAFREVVRGQDAVVIECGCNDGYHTKIMTGIGKQFAKSYRHFALEPDPRVMPIAKKQAGCTEVRFIDAAICERPGPVKLWLSSGSNEKTNFTGSSSINRPTGVIPAFKGIRFDSQAEVMGVSLDYLCKTHGIDHVDFIWADIQGAEKRMIQGGLEVCLPRTRYLYTEYSNRGLYENDASLSDITAMLPGWIVVEDFGGDVLLINDEGRAQ